MRQLARDLMIVGAVSAVGAPGLFLLYRPAPEYFRAVLLTAVATAPLVALAYARAVGDARTRPAIMLAAVGALMGALWGLAVGIAGAFAEPKLWEFSVILAAISAALQLALLGPTLARRAAACRRSWPALLGAAAIAPLLGNVSYLLLCLFTRLHGSW